MSLLRLLVLVLAVSLTAGCAVTHQVRQELLPPAAAQALVRPWPLEVGVFVPPAVRTRVIAHQLWSLPAGEAVDARFRWMLAQMFEHVVVLDRLPAGGAAANGLAGVVELAGFEYEYGVPGALRYRVVLHSGGGDTLDAWTVSAPLMLWDTGASSLSASMYGVGSELAYAMRDVMAQFMVHFADRPAVRAWLAGAGVPAGPLRPGLHGAADPPSVVRLLLLPDVRTWLHTDSAQAMRCVGQRLEQGVPGIEVVTSERMRLAFFPWLEPSTAPRTIEALRAWLDDPAIRATLRAHGVHYLLEFHGGTKTDMPGGGILCGAGYGGGGCLGFAWGSRESAFEATLLDLQRADQPQEARSRKHGKAYMPAFGLPIPLLAATEAAACEELAQHVQAMLRPGAP